MKTWADNIDFIKACIKHWGGIRRARRVELLQHGQYNLVDALKPEYAITNLAATICEVLYRFQHVCTSITNDDKLVSYVDLSKALDPQYGYLARRFSELKEVLSSAAYTKKDIANLQAHFNALYFILCTKAHRCGKINIANLRDTFENTILPVFKKSTPETSAAYITTCSAGFARMSEQLRAIALSIRASLSVNAKVRPKDSDLEALLERQAAKPKPKKKKPITVIEGYCSFAEWNNKCTTANLKPKHNSKFGGERDKQVHHHLNGFRDPAMEITISNHNGYVLYAIGSREYKFVNPLAIAFTDFLIEANLSKRDEGFIDIPIPVSDDGERKKRSQFRNYAFKSKSKIAPFKECNFWEHHIIAKKKDGHKGPKGMVRLGERHFTPS